MEELLKQTEADIAEVKNAIRRLRYKRTRTKHSTEIHNISVKILKAESMLADLLRTKAEIEEYLKVGGKKQCLKYSAILCTLPCSLA